MSLSSRTAQTRPGKQLNHPERARNIRNEERGLVRGAQKWGLGPAEKVLMHSRTWQEHPRKRNSPVRFDVVHHRFQNVSTISMFFRRAGKGVEHSLPASLDTSSALEAGTIP